MYQEIIVNTTSQGADFVADAFFTIGCQGVKIIDKNDILDVIKSGQFWDYIDENLLIDASDITKVSGFVSKADCSSKIEELTNLLNELIDVDLGSFEISVVDVDESDWFENWKKYYKPIDADGYVVVPKWINYQNVDNKTVILIDPGMAFGTGEHESTKMCLMLMSRIDFKDKKVIDVGTGSGILGIGALLKGADSCYMCDIDSCAIKAASENAELNGVLAKSTIEASDLLSQNVAPAEVVLANLTADILIRLSGILGKFLLPNGSLICSGIIHKRKQQVIDAFLQQGLTLAEEITLGEWDALRFTI